MYASYLLKHDFYQPRHSIFPNVRLPYPDIVIGKNGPGISLQKIEIGEEDTMGENVFHVFRQ